MNTQPVSRVLVKTGVLLLFWVVFLLSIYLRGDLSLGVIAFELVKSLLAAGLAWVVLSVMADALVKSMAESARRSGVDRYQGGFSYHLQEPSPEEKAWQRRHQSDVDEEPAPAPSGKKSEKD
jgi:hypothetical protein